MEPLTETEKESVVQLKSNLGDITREAHVPENYKLWDIALDKESTDTRLDVLLVKFLRAREHDLTKAKKMLTDTLIWRMDFKADEILYETFDESIFSSVGYIHKTDKEKRPVCYNFYGDIDQDKVFGDVNKFIRWRIQLMEKGVKLIDFIHVDSMVQIHDYKGASMFGRTQNSKNATKEIIKIMQDNYPEFLVTKYFVNVPWWGSTIFKLVRPLLSEATFKKFVVCSNDELYPSLTKAINEEDLADVYRSYAPKKVASQEQDAKEIKKEGLDEKEVEIQEISSVEVLIPEPSIIEIHEPADNQSSRDQSIKDQQTKDQDKKDRAEKEQSAKEETVTILPVKSTSEKSKESTIEELVKEEPPKDEPTTAIEQVVDSINGEPSGKEEIPNEPIQVAESSTAAKGNQGTKNLNTVFL